MQKPANKSKAEARAMLKSLGLLKKQRVICGEEREKVMTMLKLVPCVESNNQRFWCTTWQVGDITYNHYSGSGMDDLEEVTDE